MRLRAVLVALLLNTALHADGGTVRLRQRVGDRQVSVFTEPTPLVPGMVDIGILLQDTTTGSVRDERITLRLTGPGQGVREREATREAATNKLMQAVHLELTESGTYEVTLRIEGQGETAPFAFTLGEPVESWQALWLWWSWPALAVLLFVIHQRLKWRDGRAGTHSRVEA